MNKTILALLFSVLFSVLTVAPNVLVIINNDYDLSILIDSSEEEDEKKGEEKGEDIKVKILSKNNVDYSIYDNLASLLSMPLENYSSLFKELTSPPPENI